MTTPQPQLGFPVLKRLSYIAIAIGLSLVAWGIWQHTQLPAELDMGDPGWFSNRRESNAQEFAATSKVMFGVFLAIAGTMFAVQSSRRVQQRALAVGQTLLQGAAAAIARGQGDGATQAPAARDTVSRLAELEQLRSKGLLSEPEYQGQRARILSDV